MILDRFGLEVGLVLALSMTALMAKPVADRPPAEERLSFQSFAPWSARTNLNADVAMVYGIDPSLPDRMQTWRSHGYRTHVMTGVAWGQYQDYLYGRFDGKNHVDEAQTDRNGEKISHGGDVYYMSPGESYGRFLATGVKRALDAGALAIHLEEPEFWVRAGYSPGFQREWKSYYHEDWQAPHTSPDAQYRASKLKYYLYRRALSQVFDFVRDYGKKAGRAIPCYVATHSLPNYAHWRIVSPESSLLGVGCDGYVAQVWTGTARTPNVYEGRRQERTFETAFLEYGAMQNLVRASGRRVWYLNDPVEDNPGHSWTDYRSNWHSTLVASLLQPEVWRYEVMPWPDRVFNGRYPSADAGPRTAGATVRKETIPAAYATELQSVIRALGQMKQPAKSIRWALSGTRGTGVLVSDTMMFQRGDPSPSDANLGSFYGLAMPLVKRGLPVEPVQIENALEPGFLKPYRLLLLTYEGQKPPSAAFHDALAAWVRAGGALLVVDDDRDPYNAVREWWNTAPHHYRTPREHLFERLGLPADATGLHRVGRGVVQRAALSPAALTYQSDGADTLRSLARQAAKAVGLQWRESNALALRRGPFVVAAGLDESVPGRPAPVLHGAYIDLFDAGLPVVRDVALTPGRRALLLDLSHVDRTPQPVLAAACRVRSIDARPASIRLETDGIADTTAAVRLAMPAAPASVTLNGATLPPAACDFDLATRTLRIRFPNSPAAATLAVKAGRAREP